MQRGAQLKGEVEEGEGGDVEAEGGTADIGDGDDCDRGKKGKIQKKRYG